MLGVVVVVVVVVGSWEVRPLKKGTYTYVPKNLELAVYHNFVAEYAVYYNFGAEYAF